MSNKYDNYTTQEIKCLLARHGDTKRYLEAELKEMESNVLLMRKALWNKQEVKGE